ncbi:hypothetical protein ACHAWO_003758 [Cyclotella atomus]|uniref:RanBP2-type domain-containing protein n=1 Tax=Cyclotella atomus TaxID=382360 RepID=A0ABD3NI32_9STRA
MGFLKKMQGNYPATQNRINQQNRPHQHQQGSDPPPMPNRVYQSNGIPVAPASSVPASAAPYSHVHAQATAAAAYPSQAAPAYVTSTTPVTATAYVPGQQSSAPVVAQAFVPGQQTNTATSYYATAPTADSLPPPVAPPYNPASATPSPANTYTASGNHESKFWECTTCTFPNLKTEHRCKGCGASIPPGLYRAEVVKPAAPTHPAPAAAPQHYTTAATTTQVTQQMNNMHLSPPPVSSGTMRVPVPNGMQQGQKIKVRSPDGKEVIKPIPPRHEWSTDEHGRPFFRMTFGPAAATVVTGSAVPPTHTFSSINSNTASRPPPYNTTWRSFHPRASATYTPPPIGMHTVPHTPCNSTPIPPNGRHKSLLIGINYTGTRAALKGCQNDALNMQKLLQQNGFPNDGSHMLLLTDDRNRGNEYQPTSSNILKAFQWLLKDVQKGDVLFFHFSGHGGQVPDKSGMEADGCNETLVPLDYNRSGQISDDVLWGSLVYPLPEGVRLTALMDMCHSGTGLDLPYDYNVDTKKWKEDVNPAHSKGDVVLFSGCEDSQTSADVQSGWQAGGAMTMAFTKAYQQCCSSMATYHEFLVVVKRELRRKGMRQRPQLTSSQQFDANSRIFSFGHLSGGGGGVPTSIESNHNPQIGRKKNRHVRPARAGFGGGGGNDLFAMAAAGAGAMLFANALGNIFDG